MRLLIAGFWMKAKAKIQKSNELQKYSIVRYFLKFHAEPKIEAKHSCAFSLLILYNGHPCLPCLAADSRQAGVYCHPPSLMLRKASLSTNLNSSPSNRPLSLSLRCGITSRAMNERVINGAFKRLPISCIILSIVV